MVKLRAKKLLALALSILMLTGTVTQWLPTALAAGGADAVTAQAASPDGAQTQATPETAAAQGDQAALAEGQPREGIPPRQLDFQDADNGRPNLYVDFLGDNNGNGTAELPGQLVAPAAYNKDHRTNPIDANTWSGYTSRMVNDAGADEIIFWVGVGVDRTQVWELLNNSGNQGITSLELGFYYNKTYIEPYVGAGGYAATIERANFANKAYGHNQWSDAYQLLHAETDLPVEEGNILRADPITQDELENPSLDNIRNNQYSDTDPATDADWRMTYISLELKDLEGLNRRLAGEYTGYTDNGGNFVIPPEASGTETDDPPEYLMMIPFVLHAHDAHARLCLRLIRDASHFSIGAGNDGIGDAATGSYAAWERVTTRNQGKDLKLQLRFAGDLNIWGDGPARVVDVFHSATLLIQNGGGSQNTARLSVQEDMGATPVFVDQNNQTISNLQGGTGMQLDLTVQSGYVATVWVYYDGTDTGSDGSPVEMGWPFVTVTDQEHYTFVMPNEDVYVLVVFQPGNTRDYTLYLSEIPKPYAADYMLGNETTISSFCDQSPIGSPTPDLQPVSVNSFDPRERHPNDGHGDGPQMMVSRDQVVTMTVSTHPDYEARVHIYNFNNQKNMEDLLSAPADMERDPSDNTILILPFGGTLTFTMPQSDLDVVVEYTKVVTKTAKLEVWHQGDAAQAANVKDINIAQLAYLSYDNQAAVSTAYSGQVYEKVDATAPDDLSKRDHSAVKDPSYQTDWVPYSAATISNSLGGDTGRTGRIWSASDATGTTSLMAALANATGVSNLAGRFNALDLLGADLLSDGSTMGLRKNLDGEIYGDGELTDAAALLWELRSKVLADTTAGGLRDTYYLDGTLDASTTYKYFALTPAQVQAYQIACLEIDGIHRANRQAYRMAYQSYQEAKRIYDEVVKTPVTATATAPIQPQEPLDLQVTDATGLREYQGEDYSNDYLVDYTSYMTQYTAYITSLRDAETPTVVDFTVKPKDRPAYRSVPLLGDAAAKAAVQAAVTKYQWNNKVVDNATAEVETAATVSTRSGRTVWLLLEADSAYEVESVELLDAGGNSALKDPNTGMTLEARASTSFKNVYTFSMPREDCIIRVNYRLRGQRTLQWQVKGAAGKEKNVAHIEAYQVTTLTTHDTIPVTDPQWDNVYPENTTRPTLARRTNEGHVDDASYPDTLDKENFPVEGLLVKSQVTVRLTCDDDYRVTVTATNGSGGNPIQVTANTAAGLYTFTVPEGTNPNVVLTITYARKSQAQHQAHIRILNYDSPYSADNSGLWNNGSADISAQSDTPLHGTVSLAPGYYIYTSYALGDHGTYPYTLDGNGYNNATGAGPVSQDGQRSRIRLETTMPDEDLYIYLVVRKGLPPVEPANALTVVVLDDDNTANPLADNWAKATVYARENNALKRVELPAAGKGATGGGVLQVTHYGKVESGDAILDGDRVELDLSAAYDKGYYVSGVELAPSYLGGDLEWLPADSIANGERKLQFTMPAGSTTVTVHFSKLEGTELAPSYYIRALKTETDRDGNTVTTPYNQITTATSETIRTFTAGNSYTLSNLTNPEQVPASGTGRGAGVAGEKVTMTFQVAQGWYVQSVAVMTDGSARPADFTITSGDNDGSGGTFTADLVMPAGDAWFIVKYRQCPEDPNHPGEILPRPEIPEYAITLMVIDNDNTGEPPDPNTVTASFSGAEGVHHAAIRAGGNYDATAIQYIHAGDQVVLNHSLAPGYSLDYIIVNPTEQGIVPTYVDATTSQFTMPARNITVIAKIVKKAQQPYTADLILRPPAGMTVGDLALVGQGTFTNNGGSLANYYKNAIYSLLLNPGEQVDFDLYAFDGYYIRKVEVAPAVGATASLSGSFGYQSGGFVMPAANVYVNVYFERLWPDQVKYDLTLKVNDSSARNGNYAHFATVGGVDFPAADQRLVHGGESYTVTQAVLDGQEVHVTLNRETGFYYDPSTIQITDSSGAEIPWRMTATGLAFLMPPRSTTVEVSFRRDTRTDVENPPRRAILHIDGTVKAGEIVRLYRNDGLTAGDAAYSDGSYISNLRAGDLLHLQLDLPDASKATRWVAAAYGVDEATGEQLILPVTQVPGGGLTHFPVPTLPAGADATKPLHVYVSLKDKDEGDLDQTMTLVVQGPNGSGTATMQETATPGNAVTATAGATGSTPPNAAVGTIRAAQGRGITVTMDPASGYIISQLVVTDNQGNRLDYDWISMLEDDDVEPSVWNPNPQQQITLTVPATGGTVWVVYAPRPTDPTDPDKPLQYTAQVVVNNDDYVGALPSRNNAWLSAGTQLSQKLVNAAAGDWVSLDITVQAGYRIRPIFVSPQSFGIKPQLYLGDLDSQTTGFVMPAGDVTVYVTFVRDELDVYNATLVVKGFRGKVIDPATDLGTNKATIHSDRTGTRGPIDSSDDPISVQAAAVREWVTVTYDWDPNDSWVSSVTVLDLSGRRVPFTQKDEHTITLPMVERDIIITVTYEDKEVTPPPTPIDPPPDPTPELTPVRLHVIDMTDDHSIDTEDEGWGQVLYTPDGSPGSGMAQDSGRLTALPVTAGQTDASWGNTETIWVPAGRDVVLNAYSNYNDGVYILSAYVLYRDGGQMIECNFKPNNKEADLFHSPNDAPGFYWNRTAIFSAHPDYNDVYVFLTREAPVANEFSATLMLKSDEADTGSAAVIWTGNDVMTDFKQKATVQANGDHGRITAQRKETVTVTVTPMDGYAIDYILMTPLGIPVTPKRVGNTYTFTMPGYNVCATVYLKRSNDRQFTATVHYSEQWKNPTDLPGEHNRAVISWSPDGGTRDSREATRLAPDSDPMIVNENATVTLDVTLDDPYVVLAAYVLQGGALVPLDPALEGTKETVSMTDNSLADGTATFTMPSGDVDVYVVTTNDPPPKDWHTIVLVATDTAPSGNDSGKNKGYLNQEDAADADKRTAYSYPAYTRMDGTTYPANPPSGFAHTFMTLPEYKDDGSVNYYTVVADPDPGYEFNPYKSGLTKNNPAYVQSITPVTTFPRYSYHEPVGDCNRAVHLVFESADDLTLTVEIEDPDNPGNGTVTNAVDAVTAGLDPLSLTSTSALGSYQIMSGITSGAPVNFTVDPETGYTAMAVLKAGSDVTYLTLTPAADGSDHLTGTFDMPANDAVLTVTFFKPYQGTLELRDLSGTAHRARMTESTGTPPDAVSVDALTITSGTLEDLPNGTGLTAQMVDFDATAAAEKVTGLLTRRGSTTILTPQANAGGVDEYRHTIDRADATVTLVVTNRTDPNTDPYIAAVTAVNKPERDYNDDPVADPTIQATPTGAAFGDSWTTAHPGNTVTVTLDVPEGYEADLTATNGAALSMTTVAGPAAGQTVTFTMPAANVQVTVTYRKVEFDLTLRIVDASGKTNATTVTAHADWPLTVDGDMDVVRGGETVDVSAVTDPAAVIRSITVRPNLGGSRHLVAAPMAVGADYTGSFTMPYADTVITVVYGGDPDDPDVPKPYYLAYSAVDDPAADPANRVVSIQNTSRTALMDGSPLPVSSPHWTAGYETDSVTVSYETAPGFYATATAVRNRDNAAIPVVLLDHGTGGTATAAIPDPGENITITIHYSTEEPEKKTQDVALQLIGHRGELNNQAQTSGGTLSGLSLNGTATGRPPQYVGTANPYDPVEEIRSAATMGDDLRTLANWATNFQVVRMTVAVRNTVTNQETGEVDLLVNRYAGSATTRSTMPTVGDNEIAVIRVYYGNIFWARLHIEPHGADNRDVNGNQTSATDGRAAINRHLDRLEDMMGGETVTTTAVPGAGQRLAGVVWESASGGAVSATRVGTTDNYTFTMPGENVEFYAVYKPEDDRSYIAKVAFADDSAHLGNAGNAVTITNQSDPAAVHGTYWTTAKENEAVVVNVKVADGYKAEIITTYKDHAATHTPPYDFYINRTKFVPNLTLGKDASFVMPANTDATVTVRYTKGYDLSLEVKDASGLATAADKNAADVTTNEAPARTLHAESDGTTTADTDGPLTAVDANTQITTAVTAAGGGAAQYRVTRFSPFTGTVRVDAPGTANPYSYAMPGEDVVETVVFVNDQAPLLAKVEVKGESDVNGNAAAPIVDRTDTVNTVQGTVWTTTAGRHTIDLTLTVAKGYVAKIKVRRDNANYYANPTDETQWDWLDADEYTFTQGVYTLDDAATPPVDVYDEIPFVSDGTTGVTEVTMGFQSRIPHALFPNDIGGEEHFIFTMPDHDADGTSAPTDVTVIVEFVFAGTIPQPFDPRNVNDADYDRQPDFLEQGFIYGENRGDFAVVEIPTLIQEIKDGEELFHTDNHTPLGDTVDPKNNVKFSFFLYDAATDVYTPLTLGADVRLEPYDTEDAATYTAGDPYNYCKGDNALWQGPGHWHGTGTVEKFTGSKFKLIPTEPDAITGLRTDGAQALYDMLNNQGSLAQRAGTGDYYTRLAVIAEDTIGQKSAYTQVWIRPHFTVEVKVISYAPNHTATASLYKLMSQTELDAKADADGAAHETRDPAVFKHYRWSEDDAPYADNHTAYTGTVLGANKYYQKIGVMSSDLLGGYTSAYDPGAPTLLRNVDAAAAANKAFTYGLTLEKASHLTYTRVDLDLWAGVDLSGTTPVLPTWYNDGTLTYTISDTVYLITGDVDGDGYTKWQDYDTLYSYVWRGTPWNNTMTADPGPGATPGEALEWKRSTHNPESLAYRCDLNGDGKITLQDLNLVQTVFDYNRSVADYLWTRRNADGTLGERVLPFGFDGSVKNKNPIADYISLFGLRLDGEPIPVEPDAYWDSLVDPKTTEAVPLDNPVVDENGAVVEDIRPEAAPETPDRPVHSGDAKNEDDAVTEVPQGEEAAGWPAYAPGPLAVLPRTRPDDLPLLDDNGPGED